MSTPQSAGMTLRVLLPTEILLEEPVIKVIAEDAGGSFCLLPRHIDMATALAPGLLSFTLANGAEEFLAVDEGILVKTGRLVLVSTMNAARGPALGSLRRQFSAQFQALSERDRQTRSALARLEADFVRHIVELRE